MDCKIFQNLKEVRTPLSFLALAICIVEGLLYTLIDRASGTNLTILIIGMILLPFAILLVFYLMFKDKVNQNTLSNLNNEKTLTYDIFISAPMAAFENDNDFKSSKASLTDVIREIKRSCGFHEVFYAGREIESSKDFAAEGLAVIENFRAVKYSKYFLLIYPKKLATSALIEFGWAMAFKKPIIILVKNREDLPFLLKQIDAKFDHIDLFTYKTSSNIRDLFSKNGLLLFSELGKKHID